MAKDPTIGLEDLKTEVDELRAELVDLRSALRAEVKPVGVLVDGPRLSTVFVEAQDVPLSGFYRRSGSAPIELERPGIDVAIGVKGRIGTRVDFGIEIDGKTRSETWVMGRQVEIRTFTYTFEDFDL